MALLLALASPELELLGVTTVHGNQTLEKTTLNALRVLELAGRGDVPVAAGAERPLVGAPAVASDVHGESGLDGPELADPTVAPVETHAVDFLAERLLDAPAPVTLIPTGPLTNIALLLARHPRAAERIERVVLMGGAIAEGNVTPSAEFNIWVDPEAAARVFASGLDITMIGLDVTHRALLTPAHAQQLREAGRIGTFVADLHGFYARFHQTIYGWDGAPVHDAVAVAHVIRGDLVRTERRNVEIDCASELCRGRTVVDLWQRTDRPRNASVGVDLDPDAFLGLLIERLGRLG
jgi:inosine-uridine nucleoside N-ribohydrolase